MSGNGNKHYWRGPAGTVPSAPPAVDAPPSRRSFLKLAGFSFGGAVLAGCSRGVEHKAIPLLVKAEEITPGVSTWYASLCGGCPAGCGILAKNRDGRPIKIEGNPHHPLSQGGLCAVGQAGVLGLYDSHRLAAPHADGKPSTWDEVDKQIRGKLDAIGNKPVRLLTGTIHSPTVRAAIDRFLKRFRDARHVMVDGLSASAVLDAHEEAGNRRALPRLRLDEAEVIVGFDADFLGTWISPVEYTRGYRKGRRLDGETHSYHV